MTTDLHGWFAGKADAVIMTPGRSQRIRIVAVNAGDVVVQRLDAESQRFDRIPLRALRDVVSRVQAGELVATSTVINGKAGPVAALLNDLPSIVVDGRPQAARLDRPQATRSELGRDQLTARQPNAEVDEPLPTGWEGEPRLIAHFGRERDPKLRRAKFAAVLDAGTALACEVCGFDFAERYGEHGRGFAECHHIRPIAEGGRETHLDDLAIVCANCHRMLHLSSVPLDLEQLRQVLR